MSDDRDWYRDPHPRLRRTEYGKWLAVSEADAPIRIGVIGDTPRHAHDRFATESFAWGVLLTPEEVQP